MQVLKRSELLHDPIYNKVCKACAKKIFAEKPANYQKRPYINKWRQGGGHRLLDAVNFQREFL
jgi:hypothetical protein